MEFSIEEIIFLKNAVRYYLIIMPDETQKGQVVIDKLKAEQQLIEVNDQFEEDLNKAINGE